MSGLFWNIKRNCAAQKYKTLGYYKSTAYKSDTRVSRVLTNSIEMFEYAFSQIDSY